MKRTTLPRFFFTAAARSGATWSWRRSSFFSSAESRSVNWAGYGVEAPCAAPMLARARVAASRAQTPGLCPRVSGGETLGPGCAGVSASDQAENLIVPLLAPAGPEEVGNRNGRLRNGSPAAVPCGQG